jgi:DNA topoisomerase-1
VEDVTAAARAAGLRHVTDSDPGIRRKQAGGGGFVYVWPDGRRIGEPEVLDRIRRLAIPPAWADVWISPDPRGHLQATGRDARGRKQYRYHSRWAETRDRNKYDRLIEFGRALPRIRERVDADLRRPGLPREKVLAAAVRLLETTLIRIGNDEYAKANRSYGLTTMRDRHVDISGATVRFHFRGKGGKEREVDLRDRRLATIVRKMSELPGYELFQYVDEHGNRHRVGSGDVNEYLREIAGRDFTAKDFRTWWGTVLCLLELADDPEFESQAEAKRRVKEAIEAVADRLGNTPTICRKCYVHPAVIDAYVEGALLETIERHLEGNGASDAAEHAVVAVLERAREG